MRTCALPDVDTYTCTSNHSMHPIIACFNQYLVLGKLGPLAFFFHKTQCSTKYSLRVRCVYTQQFTWLLADLSVDYGLVYVPLPAYDQGG